MAAENPQLQRYRDKIASAQKALAEIESGQVTYHSARGNEPMRDVTAEYAAGQTALIEAIERLIRTYEAQDAQGT